MPHCHLLIPQGSKHIQDAKNLCSDFFPSFSCNIFYVYCKFNIKKTKVRNNTENCPSVTGDVLMSEYCGGDEEDKTLY